MRALTQINQNQEHGWPAAPAFALQRYSAAARSVGSASTAAASLATTVPSKNRGFCGPHGIDKGEVAEIVLGDQPVFDQLPGLGQWVAHVDDVEMPDVRAVNRVELRPERVGAAE